VRSVYMQVTAGLGNNPVPKSEFEALAKSSNLSPSESHVAKFIADNYEALSSVNHHGQAGGMTLDALNDLVKQASVPQNIAASVDELEAGKKAHLGEAIGVLAGFGMGTLFGESGGDKIVMGVPFALMGYFVGGLFGGLIGESNATQPVETDDRGVLSLAYLD
jgi:hypothetical protein